MRRKSSQSNENQRFSVCQKSLIFEHKAPPQFGKNPNNPEATKSNNQFSEKLKSRNRHIDFEREGQKTNARKAPTDVICIKCGKKFTLPFKPRKPEIYCDDCFRKKKLGDKFK